MTRTRSRLLVTLAGLGVAAAGPVPAADAAALHPQWRATGPAPGVATVIGLASAFGTTVVTDRDVDRFTVDGGDVAGFLLADGHGLRTGRLPSSLNFERAEDGVPEVAAPGTVVVPLRTTTNVPVLQQSADRGTTWRRAVVEGCPTPGAIGGSRAYDGTGGGVMTQQGPSGCVWRTEDAGAHWHVVARDVDATGVAWAGGQTYVAVGTLTGGAYYGTGPVRRSDDGGRTWATVDLPPRPAAVGEAPRASQAIGPVVAGTGGRVAVGTNDGALLDSRDGGRTFVRGTVVATNADAFADDVHATAVLPSGDVLVGGRGVYPGPSPRVVVGPSGPAPLPAALAPLAPITADGDATFGIAYRTGRDALHRIAGGRDVEVAGGRTGAGLGTGTLAAYVRDGVLWTSRDAGSHWARSRVPAGATPRAAAADGRTTVVLDRTGRLWRVRGAHWTALTRSGQPGLAALAVSGGSPVVSGRGGIYRLAGRTLRRAAGAPARVARAALAADGRRLVAVADSGAVARSADGGRHWSGGPAVRGYLDGVDVAGRTVLAVAGGRAWRSVDGGRRFVRGAALPARRASGRTNHAGRVSFVDGRHAVVAAQAHLLTTADGGRTFRPVALPQAAGPLEALWSPRGVLVQDDVSHDLLRTATLAR